MLLLPKPSSSRQNRAARTHFENMDRIFEGLIWLRIRASSRLQLGSSCSCCLLCKLQFLPYYVTCWGIVVYKGGSWNPFRLRCSRNLMCWHGSSQMTFFSNARTLIKCCCLAVMEFHVALFSRLSICNRIIAWDKRQSTQEFFKLTQAKLAFCSIKGKRKIPDFF